MLLRPAADEKAHFKHCELPIKEIVKHSMTLPYKIILTLLKLTPQELQIFNITCYNTSNSQQSTNI